jgi:hypothetical protein
MHVLTRDGFRPAAGGPGRPGEEDAAQRTKSTEVASLRVVGESMTGQVVECEIYDNVSLREPLPADLVGYWTKTIVWYQLVGGAVSRKKLTDRREQMQNRKAHLLRLAPTGFRVSLLGRVRRCVLHTSARKRVCLCVCCTPACVCMQMFTCACCLWPYALW